MKTAYVEKRFTPATLSIIDGANTIIAEYVGQGFKLTLRQLYYQFVVRGLAENTERSYKRLGNIVKEGRLAGLIEWEAIEDRTRHLRGNAHWTDPAQIIAAACESFRLDMWQGQEARPEVWVEKDALEGVIADVCRGLDVEYFACRGYVSQSEMWRAAKRLENRIGQGQQPVILYLGDHDPSGIDMTRDISNRLSMFMGGVKVRRLALNMEQIEDFKPPPNPAKITDSRWARYVAQHGRESWELDALNPQTLADLVRTAVNELRDPELWRARTSLERQYKRELHKMVGRCRSV
jgi:hypothetical protein